MGVTTLKTSSYGPEVTENSGSTQKRPFSNIRLLKVIKAIDVNFDDSGGIAEGDENFRLAFYIGNARCRIHALRFHLAQDTFPSVDYAAFPTDPFVDYAADFSIFPVPRECAMEAAIDHINAGNNDLSAICPPDPEPINLFPLKYNTEAGAFAAINTVYLEAEVFGLKDLIIGPKDLLAFRTYHVPDLMFNNGGAPVLFNFCLFGEIIEGKIPQDQIDGIL